MAAFAVPEGRAMMDTVKDFGQMDLIPLAFDFAEDDTCISRDPKTLLVGSGVDDDELDKYVATLVRWNGKGMYQETKHAAWREIPSAYIHCTEDMTVPFDYQKTFVQGMKEEGLQVPTFELATGHCPNLSATDGVVDAINKLVES
jgi:hypothetical protein